MGYTQRMRGRAMPGKTTYSMSGVLAQDVVPLLENGDRLTRAEFERRYEAMPHLKKAELIEGVVYVGSPVRHDQHGQPDNLATTWVGTYQVMIPGTTAANNTTVRLDLDNEPQPDVLLRL